MEAPINFSINHIFPRVQLGNLGEKLGFPRCLHQRTRLPTISQTEVIFFHKVNFILRYLLLVPDPFPYHAAIFLLAHVRRNMGKCHRRFDCHTAGS